MAILNGKYKVKNSQNSYDVVHLETSANQVKFDDGSNVKEKINEVNNNISLGVQTSKSYTDNSLDNIIDSVELDNILKENLKLDDNLDFENVYIEDIIAREKIEELNTTLKTKADKTELHNHSNKSVLDNITSAKVTEWNNKSTFSGSYDDLTNKPTIPSIEGLATEDFVKNEIAKIDTSIDIVDSVEDMIDTSKQYVHSKTNTWWKYKKVTIPAGGILPNVDNAINWTSTEVLLNKRLNGSLEEIDAPGSALFYFTFNDEMRNTLKTVDPVWIRMKGCSFYMTTGNKTTTRLTGFNSSGEYITSYSPFSQAIVYEETENGISDTPYETNTIPYTNNKTAPVTAYKYCYHNATTGDNSTNKKASNYAELADGTLALSLIINFASKTAITEEDLKDVYITFNEPIVSYEEIVTGGWCDTGIEYNAGDDSSVVDLGVRVSELEDRVEELEKRPVGGGNTTTSTLPSYWKNRLDDISPKIDALQKENGMDTFQFLWCSDIHGVSGTAPSNTTYIGEIGRYMMDKHNIPFFVVSGDIMSQASHAKEESMWNEYDKLTTMLSPIKNEEFLAIRGNHDGVYGSPMEYNGNANQQYHSYMGDKALFNAFMRRQTLDSHRRVFGKDGMYFYVEHHNYRIYMLNAHTFGDNSVNAQGQAVYNGFKHFVFGSEQLQWIADTLTTVKDNQKVIFVAHPPLQRVVDYTVFSTMIKHYVARTSGTGSKDITGTYWGIDTQYAKTEITFNFTDAKGSIVGWFNGHNHIDAISTDLFPEMPVIYITTAGGDLRDSYLTNGTLTRVKGTPTETAIDLVTVTSDYIYCTRIGCGYDRKYNRLTKEITIDYDSAYIPPAKDPLVKPQGSELYLNQQYSQSSGGLVDKNGYYSIIIPIEANTKYMLSLSNIANLNTNSTTLYTLDTNKSNATTINGSKYIYTMSGVTFTNAEKTSATVEFTSDFKSSYVAFVTFLGGTVSEDNLKGITVALEERGKVDVSEGKEITSEVIWQENTRYSGSDGKPREFADTVASNDITVKPGDIIKIYGFTKITQNYSYSLGYTDDTYVKYHNLYEKNPYDDVDMNTMYDVENNVMTIQIKPSSSINRIRICNYCTDHSVLRVFINAELDISNFAMPTPTNFSKIKVIREEVNSVK